MSNATDDAKFQEIVKSLEPEHQFRLREDHLGLANAIEPARYWTRTAESVLSDSAFSKTRSMWVMAAHQDTMPHIGDSFTRRTETRASKRSVAVPPANSSEVKDPHPALVGYSLFYRWMWLVMSIAALAWGIVLGLAVSGSNSVGPTTATTTTFVILGLMATLFVAGRQSRVKG